FASFTSADGLISNVVEGVGIESDGSAWFATAVGLSRRDVSGTWKSYPSSSSFPGDFKEVKVAADGTVWAASSTGGAAFFNGAVWTVLGAGSGLPSNKVEAIGFDPDGATWIGSGNTLVKWDRAIMDRVGPGDGLPKGGVVEILPDRALSGRLFLATAAAGTITLVTGRNAPVTLEQPQAADVSCTSVDLRWNRYRGSGFAGY